MVVVVVIVLLFPHQAAQEAVDMAMVVQGRQELLDKDLQGGMVQGQLLMVLVAAAVLLR